MFSLKHVYGLYDYYYSMQKFWEKKAWKYTSLLIVMLPGNGASFLGKKCYCNSFFSVGQMAAQLLPSQPAVASDANFNICKVASLQLSGLGLWEECTLHSASVLSSSSCKDMTGRSWVNHVPAVPWILTFTEHQSKIWVPDCAKLGYNQQS